MKRLMGLALAAASLAAFAAPGLASPNGPCQGPVDAKCQFGTYPDGTPKNCDVFISIPGAVSPTCYNVKLPPPL